MSSGTDKKAKASFHICLHVQKQTKTTDQREVFVQQCVELLDIQDVRSHVSHESESYQSNSMHNRQVTQLPIWQTPVNRYIATQYQTSDMVLIYSHRIHRRTSTC